MRGDVLETDVGRALGAPAAVTSTVADVRAVGAVVIAVVVRAVDADVASAVRAIRRGDGQDELGDHKRVDGGRVDLLVAALAAEVSRVGGVVVSALDSERLGSQIEEHVLRRQQRRRVSMEQQGCVRPGLSLAFEVIQAALVWGAASVGGKNARQRPSTVSWRLARAVTNTTK